MDWSVGKIGELCAYTALLVICDGVISVQRSINKYRVSLVSGELCPLVSPGGKHAD
jgi:hypothetical protein